MSNLPVEVLFKIFDLLKESDSRDFLYHCSLVCKSWNQPSQHYLYSTAVFKHVTQLEKFVEIIKNNEHLSVIVKQIVIDVWISFEEPRHRTLVAELFNHLPNLEVINSEYRLSYALIVDALYDAKLPQLKNISALPLYSEEFDNYVACVMMMKDRIESIRVGNRETVPRVDGRTNQGVNSYNNAMKLGEIFFDRMFNKLNHFPKLKELLVSAVTKDPVGLLDSVVEKCPHVQTLGVDIIFRNPSIPETGDPIILSNYTPRSRIKKFHSTQLLFNNPHILLYIMHKYPQLKSLHLANRTIDANKVLEKETASQFITYLKKIDMVTLYGLRLTSGIFSSLWKNFANPPIKHVTISYNTYFRDLVILDLFKRSRTESKDYTKIRYQGHFGGVLGHTNIIENFGETVKTLVFDQTSKNSLQNPSNAISEMIYGNFIGHALCHCPQLENLHIFNYNIKDIDNIFGERLSNKKINFQTIKIANSDIDSIVWKQLSTILYSLEHLQLINNTYIYKGHRVLGASINMIHTTIRSLTIDVTHMAYGSIFLHIHTPTWKENRYYIHDLTRGESKIFEPSHKDGYKDKPFVFYIHIQCRSLRQLEVVCNTRSLGIGSIFVSFE